MNWCKGCPVRETRDMEFRMLDGRLRDVKRRVERLETAVTRGLVLLVTNLAGIVLSLAQQALER